MKKNIISKLAILIFVSNLNAYADENLPSVEINISEILKLRNTDKFVIAKPKTKIIEKIIEKPIIVTKKVPIVKEPEELFVMEIEDEPIELETQITENLPETIEDSEEIAQILVEDNNQDDNLNEEESLQISLNAEDNTQEPQINESENEENDGLFSWLFSSNKDKDDKITDNIENKELDEDVSALRNVEEDSLQDVISINENNENINEDVEQGTAINEADENLRRRPNEQPEFAPPSLKTKTDIADIEDKKEISLNIGGGILILPNEVDKHEPLFGVPDAKLSSNYEDKFAQVIVAINDEEKLKKKPVNNNSAKPKDLDAINKWLDNKQENEIIITKKQQEEEPVIIAQKQEPKKPEPKKPVREVKKLEENSAEDLKQENMPAKISSLKIDFKKDEIDLNDFEKNRLKEVVQQYFTKEDKNRVIKIITHASNQDDDKNSANRIAVQRAINIRFNLVKFGANPSQIKVQSMGNSEGDKDLAELVW